MLSEVIYAIRAGAESHRYRMALCFCFDKPINLLALALAPLPPPSRGVGLGVAARLRVLQPRPSEALRSVLSFMPRRARKRLPGGDFEANPKTRGDQHRYPKRCEF